MGAKETNLSLPAVSHISNLMSVAPSFDFTILVRNVAPIVDSDTSSNLLLRNRIKKLDFPTPVSPIKTTFADVGLVVLILPMKP
jgi:hypothetical protein